MKITECVHPGSQQQVCASYSALVKITLDQETSTRLRFRVTAGASISPTTEGLGDQDLRQRWCKLVNG